MALTLCTGGDCVLRHSCLRHTKEITARENFFGSVPYDDQTQDCQYYLNEAPSENDIQQLAYQLWQQDGCIKNSALNYWLRASQQLILKRRRTG